VVKSLKKIKSFLEDLKAELWNFSRQL
jgi:hypothetical protein